MPSSFGVSIVETDIVPARFCFKSFFFGVRFRFRFHTCFYQIKVNLWVLECVFSNLLFDLIGNLSDNYIFIVTENSMKNH